jgi:hypothetical protein
MAKAKPKKKLGKRRKRRGRVMVELKSKEPKTVGKTIRVPLHIAEWLEDIAEGVKPARISVPSAIVQILEDAYQRSQAKQTA